MASEEEKIERELKYGIVDYLLEASALVPLTVSLGIMTGIILGSIGLNQYTEDLKNAFSLMYTGYGLYANFYRRIREPYKELKQLRKEKREA